LAPGDGGEKTLRHRTIKLSLIKTSYKLIDAALAETGLRITSAWALRRRRPAAAPRVSPARAAPCGALGHAGSTKFDRPQKRKRFWGARTSPTRKR